MVCARGARILPLAAPAVKHSVLNLPPGDGGAFCLERAGGGAYNDCVLAELVSRIPHTHVEICVIAFALTFCYALWCGGFLARRAGGALPAVPQYANSLFPTKWDQLYTALFILYFAFDSIPWPEGVAAGEGGEEQMDVLSGVIFIVASFAVYSPMMIRYWLLKPWYRPRYSPVRGACMVAGFLLLIYLGSAVVHITGINDWLIQLTGCPEEQDVVQTIKDGTDPTWAAVVATTAVFQAPVCEECAFRGFLYNILKVHSGKWCAAVGSALFFAAVHASLPQLGGLFIVGLVQCWAYEKAKSLWLPICIHTAFNALGVSAILLSS